MLFLKKVKLFFLKTVYYICDKLKKKKEGEKNMKKLLSFLLAVIMVFSFTTYAASDISGHWAESIVQKWIEAGKIKVYEDGSFKPDNNMTRAEFATVLASAIDMNVAEYSEHEFSDVNSQDWFYENVKKLVTLNVVAPGENFNPQSLITRQDVFTMAGRAFYTLSQNYDVLSNFSDKDMISDYAKDYVAGLVEAGNISGYEDGTLKPLSLITRAECVKILDGFNIVKDAYSLEGIMDRIYDGVTEALPNTMQMEITKENSEYYLGIPNMEFEEAIASEPMMGSVAHSICLVKVKEGTDIETLKKEIKEKVDPRKWICVGVEREDVIVTSKGNFILLVIDQIAPKQFEESFLKLELERKN